MHDPNQGATLIHMVKFILSIEEDSAETQRNLDLLGSSNFLPTKKAARHQERRDIIVVPIDKLFI